MSTSDAGELELRVVGGETATPLDGTATRTTTARNHQDETSGERFKQEIHHGEETPAQQHRDRSAIRQEETHKARTLKADRLRQGEASHRGDSDVQIQRPAGPRFTSCLFLRLSSHLGLHENSLDPCLHSLIEPQRLDSEGSNFQVNGRTSSPSIETVGVYPSSERIPFPAKKEEEVITAVGNELDINRDLSVTHIFSNGYFGPHEHNGRHILPCGSQPRTCTGSLNGVELEEDITDRTNLEHQTDLGDLFDPSETMLSSTVVTVLAPHWSGRLRRNKKFDGPGNSEAPGNLQDVTNRERSFRETQHGGERVPFLGPRRNTVGWSTKSDPSSLDYESKRVMTQTISLDVNSGRMDNRRTDAGALSPLATSPSPVSPVSPLFPLSPLDPNEQRRSPQTGHQGGISSLSSKPTTSSLLLSLRRFNSNGRNSEVNPSPLSSSPSDRNGKLFTTHLSQTYLNNNEPESPKPLLSPSSIPYRTTETGPVLSPSSSNHRERSTSDTLFFSTSPMNRDTENIPFTQQRQTVNRTQSSFTSSKQPFLSKGPSEKQQSSRGSNKSTNLFSETPVSSHRHTPYDHTALLNTHSPPRRTTLTSTTWWKQVSQEGTGPLTLTNTASIKDKPNTTLIQPCNDNSDRASPRLSDNQRFGSQIPNSRDNNNTVESVCKGNMNLVMKTQGGTHNVKQRNVENSPDHKSDRLVKQQYGSNLNSREPPKPYSVPDVLSTSKISRAPAQTTLSHPKDPTKHDASNGSFTANVTELPPTLLNPKSSNTPTESSSKYKNNHCPPKTNNIPVSPHNMDSQKFTKPSVSPDFTTTLNSQALTSQPTSGFPPASNTKSSFSFHSHAVSSQTTVDTPSYTGPSPQAQKFTNSTTPLGFERSYAAIPPNFHPKTVSSLIPRVNSFPKTNYSPVSTTSSSTNAAPSPSLLSPPATSAITSSPTSIPISSLLTPPATPVITSPSSETSSPKGGRTFPSSPEGEPKKQRPGVDGKRMRRVTWGDSVDMQCSEPTTVEKPDPPQVPTNPLSPSRFPRSTPSIFSFLRPGSPSRNTPLCSPTPKTTSIQVGKGEKYRSLSSDSAELASRERNKQRPGDTMIFDQGRQDSTTPRQERTLSVESGTVQCRSSAPLSLPPDFSSGYKLRYSCPPYSTLMSSRQAQGEKAVKSRLPLFSQPSQSNYTPQLSSHTDQLAVMTKPPLSAVRPSLSLSLPFQRKPATKESPKCVGSDTDRFNNNHSKNSIQLRQNSQILLVDNRVNVSTQSLPGDVVPNSTYVTETLVYSLKCKGDTATAAPKDATPKPLQHTANTPVSVETKLSQQSNTVQSKKAAGEACSHSDQSSSGSSSTESQSRDGESSSRRMKDSVLGKSRFFSVEVNSEQSPKRSRFALKKSVSTPNPSLSRSESERASKSNNKMDQVFNKLRQKFSTRRSEDDSSFPWKWKRGSQTPSVSGSSDVSDVSVGSTKTLEEQGQEKGMVLNDSKKETEATNRWTQNRYTIIPPLVVGSPAGGDQFAICSPTLETDQDDGMDYKAANQFLSCRDPSPGRSPNPSAAYPTQFRKSASSPRSPFSPFSSLSPISPFSSPDVAEDSVFYSPKLQRRRDSSSPCEPGEGISLGGPRRSRASTGPPSASPGQESEQVASSYADLKYGIEPGRSFSVSSVLSSRPSGPGRISTGSRFMSVGDLSHSALSCGGNRDLDRQSVPPDWTTEPNRQSANDCQMSYFPSDPGKMRSRSLPRSLTRCLANWNSEESPPQPVTAATSKPTRLWSPNMNTCHFAWDTAGPPTPPPTPPLSPVSRRMSQPPSLSSPTFPSSSGALQQGDSQSFRGHSRSKGYVSSLSTFEESSDSSSDTTTDDEYYLETDEDGEKETEL